MYPIVRTVYRTVSTRERRERVSGNVLRLFGLRLVLARRELRNRTAVRRLNEPYCQGMTDRVPIRAETDRADLAHFLLPTVYSETARRELRFSSHKRARLRTNLPGARGESPVKGS